MKIELEAKFLDVNAGNLKGKIKSLGGRLVHPERLMKRRVFDFPDSYLYQVGAWVRVRDEGDKITLSYKKLVDRSLYGTKEITVVVDDFNQTCDFLAAVGLVVKSYQETKRERWELKGCEITFDTWPWIPTFVEVESENEAGLKAVVKELDLDWSAALHGSVETAYQKYYDVTEKEIDDWSEIIFKTVPDWLEIKRR